jgi:hypothetical protein
MEYYTYLYLRENGSPYYVGKGSKTRAYDTHRGHRPPKDRSRILIQHWIDEDTAFAYEIYLIDFWGRKDLGTGILHNHSDGGENPPRGLRKGTKHTEESKAKMRKNQGGFGLGGIRHTKESREKMSLSRLGTKATEETKRILSDAHKGFVPSEEHRKKMSESLKGRVSPMKGRKHSEKTLSRLRVLNLGRRHTEEALEKMRISAIERERRKRDAKSLQD